MLPCNTWLVGCFGFNVPLRQYFSLYRAVSREGETRERTDESKNVQTTPPARTASAAGPCPTVIGGGRVVRWLVGWLVVLGLTAL